MTTCRIQWVCRGYEQVPSTAKAMCLTHNFELPNTPFTPFATVCPIGQIEDATAIALQRIDDSTKATTAKPDTSPEMIIRAHNQWCSHNDVAHAWKGLDNKRGVRQGDWLEVRYCENCGLKQTRPIIHNTITDWEGEP